MREGLWEVADEPLVHRVVLLREQPEVVPKRKQALEQGVCRPATTDQRQVVHQPETAREEGSFARRKPIRGVLVRDVAHHESVAHQLPLNRVDGTHHARIGGGQKPDLWDEQQGGVELLGSVILRESVSLSVVSLATDLVMDLGAHLLEAFQWHVETHYTSRLGRHSDAVPR